MNARPSARGDGWTVADAAALLDPPMAAAEVRALITAARIAPSGVRRTGRPGRPSPVYDPAELLRAHAAVMTVTTRLDEQQIPVAK